MYLFLYGQDPRISALEIGIFNQYKMDISQNQNVVLFFLILINLGVFLSA